MTTPDAPAPLADGEVRIQGEHGAVSVMAIPEQGTHARETFDGLLAAGRLKIVEGIIPGAPEDFGIDADTAAWSNEPDVAASITEALAADDKARELEARILAGDGKVTIEDIEAAERQGKLALLRARGQAARAARAAEKARRARIEELTTDLLEASQAVEKIEKAFGPAVSALSKLAAHVVAYNDRQSAVMSELVALESADADKLQGHGGAIHRWKGETLPTAELMHTLYSALHDALEPVDKRAAATMERAAGITRADAAEVAAFGKFGVEHGQRINAVDRLRFEALRLAESEG